MLFDILLYSLAGYLSGSILYSSVYVKLFSISDITINSRDHTPGVVNAFRNGGRACGMFTLCFDFFKAFLPVWLFLHNCWHAQYTIGLALVMAAPVLGNNFSCFHHFKGGKGVATSFGALCALLPDFQPAALLALLFLIFRYVLIIKPAYYRILVTYVLYMILSMFLTGSVYACFGGVLISFIVTCRMILSTEEKEAFSMEPVWKKTS